MPSRRRAALAAVLAVYGLAHWWQGPHVDGVAFHGGDHTARVLAADAITAIRTGDLASDASPGTRAAAAWLVRTYQGALAADLVVTFQPPPVTDDEIIACVALADGTYLALTGTDHGRFRDPELDFARYPTAEPAGPCP